MPPAKLVKAGEVAALCISGSKSSIKAPVDRLSLTFAGAKGDGHNAMARPAGVREPAYKRGTEIANLRQLSLVSMEELADIARRMNLDRIEPGWLAANIALEGAGPITQLPRGTIIRFQPSGASVYVTDVNTPCSFAAKLVGQGGGYAKTQTSNFVKHALGRRGLVALVYTEGEIAVGNTVEFLLSKPELPRP